MEDKPTIELLSYQLEELTKMTKEGFAGIHNRQDLTNGNVKKNTEYRYKTEGQLKLLCRVVYGLVGMILIAFASAVLKLIIV